MNKINDQVRDEILKAEIISLFTLLEKTFTKWWNERDYLKSSPILYDNPEAEIENNLLKDLENISLNLKIKESSQNSLNAWDDFLHNWRRWRRINLKDNPEKFIQVLYGGCEGINSGIEKGSPKEQIKGELPFLTSSFGTFKNFISHKKLDDLRDLLFKSNASAEEKMENFGELFEISTENFFNDRHKKFLEKNIADLLQQFQNGESLFNLSLARTNLYCQIYLLYSHIPSDSRFPANDTSLFDQAYMATALFKAALSGIVLSSQKDSESESIEIVTSNFDQNKLKWSILGIQYDKLSLAEKGLKPGFIQWYRSACERAGQAIKQLLEIRYPFGNEVYRDETGIYFVVAENLTGKSDGDFYELSTDLQELKQKIWDIFSTTFGGEMYPAIRLTKPSRGLMNLGHLIEKAEENFLKAERPENFVEELQKGISSGEAGLCQVCRMRPADRGDDETLICEVCRERREGRIKSWLNHPEGETIWTGELQDKNGRMALVTLKFELEKWLNGDFLNTLLIRNEIYKTNLKEIENFIFLFLKKSEFNVDVTSLNEKVKELSERLKNSKGQEEKRRLGENKGKLIGIKNKIEKLVNIINAIKNSTWWEKSLKNDIGISAFTGKGIEEIVNILIEDYNEIKKEFPVYELENISFFPTILAEDAYKGCKNNDETFEDFVRQVFFGSIVGTFWEEIVKSKFGNDKIDWTLGKEKILWDNLTTSDIEFLSQLFLQFLLRKNPSPARLRRIWETTKEFLENINKDILKILGYPEEGKQRLIWNNVNLRDGEYKDGEIDFWVENRKCYLITSIEKVKNKKTFRLKPYKNNADTGVELSIEDSKNQSYWPILSIISPTPVSWQFAMPADRVPVLLEKLKERYNELFKWVYGKLPLHVGIVVQHYKRPLYVGIKALRKIRRDHASWIDLCQETSGCYLKAKQKEAFQFAHPAEVENGSEAFYSLYELSNKEGQYQFYLYPEKDGERWLDTTQNHGDKDNFFFYPNTFDFEFLDANARRNDIYYQRAKRATSLKANRPYWLDDFQYFQEFREFFNKSLSISKLQKLVSLIYSRLEDWEDDDSLKIFMVASFVNILDLKDEKQRNVFAKILKFENWKELKKSPVDEFRAKLKMLLDMFNFYHSMLKLLPEEEK